MGLYSSGIFNNIRNFTDPIKYSTLVLLLLEVGKYRKNMNGS
jgi:hypothetical protein